MTLLGDLRHRPRIWAWIGAVSMWAIITALSGLAAGAQVLSAAASFGTFFVIADTSYDGGPAAQLSRLKGNVRGGSSGTSFIWEDVPEQFSKTDHQGGGAGNLLRHNSCFRCSSRRFERARCCIARGARPRERSGLRLKV